MSYDTTIDGYLKTINLIRHRALLVRHVLRDIAAGSEPKAAQMAAEALEEDREMSGVNPLEWEES